MEDTDVLIDNDYLDNQQYGLYEGFATGTNDLIEIIIDNQQEYLSNQQLIIDNQEIIYNSINQSISIVSMLIVFLLGYKIAVDFIKGVVSRV